jgi:hypothetical protein
MCNKCGYPEAIHAVRDTTPDDKPTGLTDEQAEAIYLEVPVGTKEFTASDCCTAIPCKHALGDMARRIEAIVREEYEIPHTAAAVAVLDEAKRRLEMYEEQIVWARKDERERVAAIVEKRIDCRDFDGLIDAILRGEERE